jgi:hypothetical protein
MRVYIAAPRGFRVLAGEVATTLRQRGHMVVSMWHDTRCQPVAQVPGEPWHHESFRTRVLVGKADAILLVAHPDCRGSLMEFGTAYDSGLRCVAVGDRTEVTPALDLPGVEWVGGIPQAMDLLDRPRGKR